MGIIHSLKKVMMFLIGGVIVYASCVALYEYHNTLPPLEVYSLRAQVKDFTRKIEENPLDGNVFFERALVYQKLEKRTLAGEDFTHALMLIPDDVSLIFLRGANALGNDGFDHAILDFNRVLMMNHEHVNALLLRGYSYHGQKKYSLAIDDFESVLLLQPGDLDALSGLKESRLGEQGKLGRMMLHILIKK
jgi:lipoprotein NlpI